MPINKETIYNINPYSSISFPVFIFGWWRTGVVHDIVCLCVNRRITFLRRKVILNLKGLTFYILHIQPFFSVLTSSHIKSPYINISVSIYLVTHANINDEASYTKYSKASILCSLKLLIYNYDIICFLSSKTRIHIN